MPSLTLHWLLTLTITTLLCALITAAPSSSSCNSNITATAPNADPIHFPIPSTNPPLRLSIDELSPEDTSPSVLQLLVRALASQYIVGRAPGAQFSVGSEQQGRVMYAGLRFRFWARIGEPLVVGDMVKAVEALGDYMASKQAFGKEKRVRIEHEGQREGAVAGLMFMYPPAEGCGVEEDDGPEQNADAVVATS